MRVSKVVRRSPFFPGSSNSGAERASSAVAVRMVTGSEPRSTSPYSRCRPERPVMSPGESAPSEFSISSAVASPAEPSRARAKVRVGARDRVEFRAAAPGISATSAWNTGGGLTSSWRRVMASTKASGPAAWTWAAKGAGSSSRNSASAVAELSSCSASIRVLSRRAAR